MLSVLKGFIGELPSDQHEEVHFHEEQEGLFLLKGPPLSNGTNSCHRLCCNGQISPLLSQVIPTK